VRTRFLGAPPPPPPPFKPPTVKKPAKKPVAKKKTFPYAQKNHGKPAGARFTG
jgi:hypothetical protein